VEGGVGLLWATTAGASWSREFRVATVRLRGAWGNGIRPPEPGMNQESMRDRFRQEANPGLVAERQRGVETGVDVFVAGGGYFKLTLYDQRAIDLIQPVLTRRVDASLTTYMFQNVGAVRNRGSELEAGYERGGFSTSVTAYFPRSTVTRLGRGYSGELQLGDELLEVPDAAGAWMIGYDLNRLRAEIGISWIGSWIGYDRRLIADIEQQLRPAGATSREYWRTYDAVVRPYACLSTRVGAHLAFVRVDNFGNSSDAVRDNLSPSLGRTILFGIARQ
jgi:outer membrane receptor protein involved in Fe transport